MAFERRIRTPEQHKLLLKKDPMLEIRSAMQSMQSIAIEQLKELDGDMAHLD